MGGRGRDPRPRRRSSTPCAATTTSSAGCAPGRQAVLAQPMPEHTVLLYVERLDAATREALWYAQTIANGDLRAFTSRSRAATRASGRASSGSRTASRTSRSSSREDDRSTPSSTTSGASRTARATSSRWSSPSSSGAVARGGGPAAHDLLAQAAAAARAGHRRHRRAARARRRPRGFEPMHASASSPSRVSAPSRCAPLVYAETLGFRDTHALFFAFEEGTRPSMRGGLGPPRPGHAARGRSTRPTATSASRSSPTSARVTADPEPWPSSSCPSWSSAARPDAPQPARALPQAAPALRAEGDPDERAVSAALARIDQSVAGAGLGQEIARPGRVGLDLAAELRHVHVEVVGLLRVPRPPDLAQDIRWVSSFPGLGRGRAGGRTRCGVSATGRARDADRALLQVDLSSPISEQGRRTEPPGAGPPAAARATRRR